MVRVVVGRRAAVAAAALAVAAVAVAAKREDRVARAEEVEQPAYAVVDRVGSVEIRSYGPLLAAETDMGAGPGVRSGQYAAFMALADFIFAKNRQGPGVAMTAPVSVEQATAPIAMTAPVAVEPDGKRRVMRFFMPAEYTAETLPRPGDERVRIVTVPARTLAVLRFAGEMDDAAVADHDAALLAALAGSDWRPVGEPGTFGYDPPGTPPAQRRSEVFVEVVAAGAATPAAGTPASG